MARPAFRKRCSAGLEREPNADLLEERERRLWMRSACSSVRTSKTRQSVGPQVRSASVPALEADVADLELQVEVGGDLARLGLEEGSGDCRRYRTSVQWSK